MIYPFEHDDFQGRNLAISTAGFFKSVCLLENDVKIKGKRNKFTVNDNQGSPREINLKMNFLDPIPKIEIDGTIIKLARSLTWYEYLWMGLPIMLIFVGGGLGAMFGFGATYISGRIFRSGRKVTFKYLLSGVVSISAVTAYFVLAVAIQYLIDMNRDKASQEYLMEVAEITNKDLPVTVDDQTELVKLDGLEGVLVYYYRLPNIIQGQLSENYLIEQLRPIIINQTCTTPDTREDFLENGVTLRYIYNAKDSSEIAQFDVKISDCD
jgi:hypothetical protein